MQNMEHGRIAKFHLPGLFSFYEFYKEFLPLYRVHRDWYYPWVEITSLYGAPSDCIWGGGRFGGDSVNAEEALSLAREYGISARLTFSNSLLKEEHLHDTECNRLCALFEKSDSVQNGVIVHSDLLLAYLKNTYPGLYLVSSTTKVLTDFEDLKRETEQEAFRYVVPDFRLNKNEKLFRELSPSQKDKIEFLCNECCWVGCKDRAACYRNVSERILGQESKEWICTAPDGRDGYKFSKAMQNPTFIGIDAIRDVYLPAGFSNFKIEGRGLGSAVLLEFLLHYLTKPEHQLEVREEIYLDSMLDLF